MSKATFLAAMTICIVLTSRGTLRADSIKDALDRGKSEYDAAVAAAKTALDATFEEQIAIIRKLGIWIRF